MHGDELIHVSWLNSAGKLTKAVEHSIQHYAGVVPDVGDVLVVSIALEDEEIEHCVNKVVERYCVSDLNGDPSWYLVLAEADLPSDRLAMLTAPRPDMAGQVEALRRAERKQRHAE